MKNTSTPRPKRTWSDPSANPARVAAMRLAGTTPSTMSMLEPISCQTWPVSNAVAKLPHCGSVGQVRPVGLRSAGCRAAENMLTSGSTVTITATLRRR